jgi:archaellum component FlaD/FlaE
MISDASRDAQAKPRRAQMVEEDEAMKRAKEVIEKARSATSAPADEPVTSDKEKEAVPA